MKPVIAIGGALLLLGSVGALEIGNIGFIQAIGQSMAGFSLMMISGRV